MSVTGSGEASTEPARAFVSALKALHLRAGKPSARSIARAIGNASHTTVAEALAGKRIPSWPIVASVVSHLGGNEREFRLLWASLAERLPADAQVEGPAFVGAPGPHGPPRELPPDVAGFTGRLADMAALDQLLRASGDRPNAVTISAIAGTAGAGKTALAVHWAHRVAHQFPDGQLYVNLRGFGPDHPEASEHVLAAFLRALGVDNSRIPQNIDERAALFRSIVAERRVLVLLDNASSADQVRPLLPASPGSFVIVTSRSRFSGLAIRDGAQQIELNVLPLDDATDLLRTLIGVRAEVDPESTVSLALLCACLPLALRVAAELVLARPGSSVRDLVHELGDQQDRLNRLDAIDDSRTAIRGVFDWSYQRLREPEALVFRRVGLFPGPDFDRYSAAVLSGETTSRAEQSLRALVGAHLINATSAKRYDMHDLLRVYAAELSAVTDDSHERALALANVCDYFLAGSIKAVRYVYPHSSSADEADPGADADMVPIVDSGDAMRWLEAERANLVAVSAWDAEHGSGDRAIRLANVLFPFFYISGYYSDGLSVLSRAQKAARNMGDVVAQSRIMINLGMIDIRLGRYESAAERLEEAIANTRDAGDARTEARALTNLGHVHVSLDRLESARGLLERAAQIYQELADLFGAAQARANIGMVDYKLGRYSRAHGSLVEALRIFQQLDYPVGEVEVLNGLGDSLRQLRRTDEALARYREAFELAATVGDPYGRARASAGLGDGYNDLGETKRASDLWSDAFGIYTDLGVPEAEEVRARLAVQGIPEHGGVA